MKQTITTENYKATVDIPYEKLASSSHKKFIPNHKSKETVIYVQGSNCHSCCYPTSNNEVTMQMLEDLQEAYKKDMDEMKAKIEAVEDKRLSLEMQLKVKNGEINQLKNEKQIEKQEFSRRLNEFERQKERLNFQIQKLKKEHEHVLKSKITQFHNQVMMTELQQEEKSRLIRLQVDSGWEDLLKRKQTENALALTNFEEKLSQLSSKLGNSQDEYSLLLKEKEAWEISKAEMSSVIQNQLVSIKMHEEESKIAGEKSNLLTSDMLTLKKIIEERNTELIDKVKQIQTLKEKINNLIGNVEEEKKKHEQTVHNYRILEQHNNGLKNENYHLHQTIIGLKKALAEKDLIIRSKEEKKLYQVKIEKVIDKEDYIKELQKTIEKLRLQCLEYSEKLKRSEECCLNEAKENEELRVQIHKLKTKIVQLKAYIEEKEKSFSWIVERQITKDIQLNQHEKNRNYRVLPLKEKEPSLLPECSAKQEEGEKIQTEIREIIIKPDHS